MSKRYFSTLLQAFLLLSGLTATSIPVFGQYCTPVCTATCNTGDFVNSFTTSNGITNISNTNTGCNGNTNNYAYYTTQTATAARDSIILWSFQNGPNSQENYGVWVDWNQNGVFTDTLENIYMNSNVTPNQVVPSLITVPHLALLGTTRLRIICSKTTSVLTSCGNIPNGETEDYNFNVISTTGIPAANAGGTNAVIVPNPSSSSALLQWTLVKAVFINIRITDMVGKIIWEKGLNGIRGLQQISLPVPDIKGIYSIQIQAAGNKPQILRWISQ